MTSKYVLSIIIPHFNCPLLLERMIKSIPNDERIQIIIVDDKSDCDVDILNSVKTNYQSDRIIFMSNGSEKKGAGVARNLGLEYALGKWVFFADADDYIKKNSLQIFLEHSDSDEDVIYFVPYCYNDNMEISESYLNIYEKKILNYSKKQNKKNKIKLCVKPENPPWIMMINREFINSNNLKFSQAKYANDIEFTSKVGILATKFKVSEEGFYCVVERDGSLTKIMSDESFLIRATEYIKTCAFLRKKLSHIENIYARTGGLSLIIQIILSRKNIKLVKSVLQLCKQYKVPILY